MKILKIEIFKSLHKILIYVKDMDFDKNKFIKDLKINLDKNFEYKIISINSLKEKSLECFVEYSYDSMQEYIKFNFPMFYPIFSIKPEINSENLIYKTSNDFIIKRFNENNLNDKIKKFLKYFFDLDVNIQFIKNENLVSNNSMEYNISKIKFEKKETYVVESRKTNEDIDENIIVGKIIQEKSVDINLLDVPEKNIVIEGTIFNQTLINTKTGKKLISFFVHDDTSSINVKYFLKTKDSDNIISKLSNNVYVKIKGEVIIDQFTKELTIMAYNINLCKKIERLDKSNEKRVELHLHTNMSTMDSVINVNELFKMAKDWGHKAIAITDHNVVQAYPSVMDASKKFGIKAIYGIEINLVDDLKPLINKVENQTIDDSFVVFDIETTGFSNLNEKIIEIGAVKIKDGKIVDEFSTFINPERNIPIKITELTGITNDMVCKSPIINDVIGDFYKFCEDSIMVAHNIDFDMSFIRRNGKSFGFEFSNSLLDTIDLCKFLFPELKRYKLNVVAKHLGVSLENHHRAVDDAKATAMILIKCFEKLKSKNIITLKHLNDEYIQNINISKLYTIHAVLLAKNQVGLKNIYKLVSKGHLDYFFKTPRIPKSELLKHREGLIIGSSFREGEIFKGIIDFYDEERLKEISELYDYFEVSPPYNCREHIKSERIVGYEEAEEIIKLIYDFGRKNNKLVVAVSNAHYIEKKHNIYRNILRVCQNFKVDLEDDSLYFRTTKEMFEEFKFLPKDIANEIIVLNPNKISDMIEETLPIPKGTFPPKIDGADEEIRKMTFDKAHSIYGNPLPDIIQERLDKEINSIINNGYAVLYLIAHKLVKKSLDDGYLVGSRGSVGSSIVATFCGITEVNGLPPHYVCPNCKNSEFILDGSVNAGVDLPTKKCNKCESEYLRDGFDIPFETFLGFDGDKEPDIDLNFSGEYQPTVHKYTEELFGKGFVFRAGTIGTIAEKTAYGYVKKYIEELSLKMPQSEVERLSKGLTGVKRTTGQHPGGIMVVPKDNDIFNFTPIQHPADDKSVNVITTHFDYHSISGRLLKLDILGHDDPTMLKMLKDLTGLNPQEIPLNDSKVLSLFNEVTALGIDSNDIDCEVGTLGIPEFGTKFVRQMLLDTKPTNFSDLVRISGLSHGTDVWLNNAQEFIKNGNTTLKGCISTRDDIMVYLVYKGLKPKAAFDIMENVRKGKGLTLEQEKIMIENNIEDWYIESCKRIKYMFPKGHAVAYVMMAVRIAYYKVYYPLEYYTAYCTVRADEFDADLICNGTELINEKLNHLKSLGNNLTQKDKGLLTILEIALEAYARGIKFYKVDLYRSHYNDFKIENGGILPPIKSLQGVGSTAAKNLYDAGNFCEFISLQDLKNRAKVSKTVIETLQSHGCIKDLPETNQTTMDLKF